MGNKWKNVADTCAFSEKYPLQYCVTSCRWGEGGGPAAAAAAGGLSQGENVV